ncbi:MAG: type II toxin-antitoxin system Phd/YefM family antitoxin [bacterium]|nr:type II toxin-antitoxin system Phd/YefM family antitoxin [bacterium]
MKTQAAELLRTVSETRRPVVITEDGEPMGVLLDVASYQSLKDTSLMLKLIGLSEDEERAGKTMPQDEVFAEARQRLASR